MFELDRGGCCRCSLLAARCSLLAAAAADVVSSTRQAQMAETDARPNVSETRLNQMATPSVLARVLLTDEQTNS